MEITGSRCNCYPADDGEESIGFEIPAIRYYVVRKKEYLIFLKDDRLICVKTETFDEEKREFILRKLSASGVWKRFVWKVPALLILLAATLLGSFMVGKSAVHLNGKLAWVIDDWKNHKKVEAEHTNLYQDGVEGIFSDIGKVVLLPKQLSLASSFNLHFLPDGTIETMDTMLYGFDEDGNFVNSYLITYDVDHSDSISIYLNGAESATYDQTKDFSVLMEAVSVMPLEDTVRDWNQKEYGLLYYGVRQWTSVDTGLFYLDEFGKTEPVDDTAVIEGYSISVFCPEQEEIPPVRYLPVETRGR